MEKVNPFKAKIILVTSIKINVLKPIKLSKTLRSITGK
jgi:hypothetical protein